MENKEIFEQRPQKVGLNSGDEEITIQSTQPREPKRVRRTSSSIDSIGFQNYLRNFLKFKADVIQNEILKQAVSQYKMQCSARRAIQRMAKREEYAPLPIEGRDKIDFGFDSDDDCQMMDEPMDGCGRKRKKRCNPGSKASIGFKNYFKMYLCRYPQLEKCEAYKKARCLYKNFTERTKNKYRSLGCEFECCPKQKATVKKPGCPCPSKPKRKKAAACAKPKKRKAKCPEPQPCCPKPKPKPCPKSKPRKRARSRSCCPPPPPPPCPPKKPFCP